jgi:hypothetical protein
MGKKLADKTPEACLGGATAVRFLGDRPGWFKGEARAGGDDPAAGAAGRPPPPARKTLAAPVLTGLPAPPGRRAADPAY